MTVTFNDYLLAPSAGVPGAFVQLVNNDTLVAYVSTTATSSTGLFEMDGVPAGEYTVSTGPTAIGPWTPTGETRYLVAESVGFANPMTTAGDLILGGGAGAPGRIAKGADYAGLIVSASTHLPVWAVNQPVLYESFTLGSPTTTFIFDNIPQTFSALQLRIVGRGTDATNTENVNMRFNSDAGADYDTVAISTTGASSSTTETVAGAQFACCIIPAADATAAGFGNAVIDIFDYTSTTRRKTFSGRDYFRNVDGALEQIVETRGGTWHQLSAITRITLFPNGGGNFDVGSSASLYLMP